MPVFDPAAIAGILADLSVSVLTYAGIAALLYSIGGILIRTVGWTFDKLLINFIGFFYKYFETIVNGELLTDSVVKGMMDRVYLLVGVFVVFRLGMLLFNYMLNPSEVMDEKVGVNALVKRVILGLILIIFMPNIFGFAFRLQNAILDDQVIERIIMPESDMSKVKSYKEKHGMGKIIGMTIFNGFFSVSSSGNSDSKVTKTYNKAMDITANYDLSVVDRLGIGLDSGILYKSGSEYAFDYFPIFSTVVLGYVLYLLIQYCLDAVVRSFKLSVLQVIAPVCIVEYMINGDRNEVFKSWRKAVIATFAMLFMRVASIWFVAYITMLMQKGATGISADSLLQSPDNLLKAIIVLGLLAFMMDFPKMMSDVFGLDLDQSGSVKNVMGKAMGAATAGLAIGGAVAGLGMKAAGGTAKAINAGRHSMTKGAGLKANMSSFASGFASNAKQNHLGSALTGGLKGVGSAIMGSNSITGSVQKGYSTATDSASRAVDKEKSKEAQAHQEDLEMQTTAYQQHQMQVADAQLEQQQNINIKLGVNENIDSVDVVSRAQGLSDFSSDDTVLGNLQNMNRTMDVTRDTVVNINDNVQSVVNTTNDISRNVETAVNTTQTIAQNTDTIVNQTEHISNQVDKIEDNTFYSGIDSINNMENSNYVDKPIKNLNGNAPEPTAASKPKSNDDIETL